MKRLLGCDSGKVLLELTDEEYRWVVNLAAGFALCEAIPEVPARRESTKVILGACRTAKSECLRKCDVCGEPLPAMARKDMKRHPGACMQKWQHDYNLKYQADYYRRRRAAKKGGVTAPDARRKKVVEVKAPAVEAAAEAEVDKDERNARIRAALAKADAKLGKGSVL